jgi:hypothetical protein
MVSDVARIGVVTQDMRERVQELPVKVSSIAGAWQMKVGMEGQEVSV